MMSCAARHVALMNVAQVVVETATNHGVFAAAAVSVFRGFI
jgi:hypothetical protein